MKTFMPDYLQMPDLEPLPMDRSAILDLLEARKSLEVSNAALAAEKRTDHDLRELDRIMAGMESHLGDVEEGEKADMLFHLTLAKATGNSVMVRLLEAVTAQMEAAVRETRRLQMYANLSVSEQLWREHQDICAAIRNRDAALAQEKMRLHLFHVERVLIRSLK